MMKNRIKAVAIDYSKLTDHQIIEIRNHWRSESRSTRGQFDYAKQLNDIEEEYKRRFG